MRKPAFIILTLLQQVVREAQLVVVRTKHDFRRPFIMLRVMRRRGLLLTVALASVGAMTLGAQQGQPADPKRTPGVQGPADPNRAAFLAANCKNAPAPAAARGGGGAPGAPAAGGGAPGAAGGGRAGGGAPAAPPAFQDVASTEIPGVIAA